MDKNAAGPGPNWAMTFAARRDPRRTMHGADVSNGQTMPTVTRLLKIAALVVTTPAAAQLPTLVKVGEIGCSDCATAAQFSSITHLAVTDSGDVLVIAGDSPMLRLFDRSGKVSWTAGRAGKGPGEFGIPISAAIGPAGIQVVDMSLRRTTRLDREGSLVGSIPVRGFATAVGARARTGEMVVLVDDFRGTFTLHRLGMTDSGATIGTVPPSTSPSTRLTNPSIAVDPAGRIAVMRDPDEYVIVLISPDGQVAGEIRRDIARVRMTPEEIAARDRRRSAVREKLGAERGRSGSSAPLLSSAADNLKPHVAINGLRFDDSGRLWTRTMRGNQSSTVFDLFAPDGRYLGEVTVPGVVGTVSVAGRWFVADVESEDGTPRIAIWHLQ